MINIKYMELSWQIEGEQQLARRFELISKGLKNWTPAFRKAAKDVKKTFETDVFNTQGSIIGEKWKPLRQSTIAQKARQGYSTTPLVATGKMQKSFMSMYKSDIAAVWNTAFYFQYHQSNKPRRKLPRRVMMKLDERQRQEIVKIFHKHLRKIIK